MEVVASLSQGRTAAAQCGLFTHKSVPVIFEPPCNLLLHLFHITPQKFLQNYIKALYYMWQFYELKYLQMKDDERDVTMYVAARDVKLDFGFGLSYD